MRNTLLSCLLSFCVLGDLVRANRFACSVALVLIQARTVYSPTSVGRRRSPLVLYDRRLAALRPHRPSVSLSFEGSNE